RLVQVTGALLVLNAFAAAQFSLLSALHVPTSQSRWWSGAGGARRDDGQHRESPQLEALGLDRSRRSATTSTPAAARTVGPARIARDPQTTRSPRWCPRSPNVFWTSSTTTGARIHPAVTLLAAQSPS